MEAIRSIGHTVMMLSPWHMPVTLTRAWCLWELFATVAGGEADGDEDGASRFTACLGPAERQAFERELLTNQKGWDAVTAAFSEIDVRQAEAGNPADLEMIMTNVDRYGGPERLSTVAVAELRGWVQRQARRMVAVRRRADGSIEPTALGLTRTVAALLEVQGELAEARSLKEAVLAGWLDHAGADHVDTLKARANFEAGLPGLARTLDLRSPAMLAVSTGLADALLALADAGDSEPAHAERQLVQAEELLRAVVAGRAEAASAPAGGGPLPQVELHRARFNLAALLQRPPASAAPLAEAPLLAAAISGLTDELGRRHPEVLTAQASMAAALRQCDRGEEAIELLAVVAVGRASVLSLLISIKAAHASRPRGAPAREIHFSQILYNTLRRTSPHSGGPQNFDTLVFLAPAARSNVYAYFYRGRKTQRVWDLGYVL
jgi:hypothetical protein